MSQKLNVATLDTESFEFTRRQTPPNQSTNQPAEAESEHRVALLEVARLLERVTRRYLDLLRLDLARLGIEDISPTQVMVLLTVGTNDISVRDLLDRGYYLGSNASYNLKHLVANDYIHRTASTRDRRLARIRLSEKGQRLCELLRSTDQIYQDSIAQHEEQAQELQTTFRTLRKLEELWTNSLRYGHSNLTTGIGVLSCMSLSFIDEVLGNFGILLGG